MAFPGLNHLAEGCDSPRGEHRVRHEVKSTLPCSLSVCEVTPQDSGQTSLQGHRGDVESLLEQQEWRSTWGHQHHLPNPKVGATSWLGYDNGCITGPSSHSLFSTNINT